MKFLRVYKPQMDAKRDLVDMFHDMYEAEFRDVPEESEEFSINDHEWMKEVSSTIRKDDQNHYEVALPRVKVSEIHERFPAAKRRLEGLRSRFRKDPEYFSRYRAVIKSLADDGYAAKVPDDELEAQAVWYHPHHGV